MITFLGQKLQSRLCFCGVITENSPIKTHLQINGRLGSCFIYNESNSKKETCQTSWMG